MDPYNNVIILLCGYMRFAWLGVSCLREHYFLHVCLSIYYVRGCQGPSSIFCFIILDTNQPIYFANFTVVVSLIT